MVELFEKFTEESFIYQTHDCNEPALQYIIDIEITELPEWSLFDTIAFERVKDVGGRNIESDYFPYKNLSKTPLERYQILMKEKHEKDKKK